jgi:hypothetical protein
MRKNLHVAARGVAVQAYESCIGMRGAKSGGTG